MTAVLGEAPVRWKRQGAIMVPVPFMQPAEPLKAPKWRVVHDLVACPTCRARVDECCRSSSGHKREPHLNRLVPRRCSCGGVVDPRCKFCPPCRRKRDQASKNEHGRQRRLAKRGQYA